MKKGFILIELLVVVAIIGILFAIVFVAVKGRNNQEDICYRTEVIKSIKYDSDLMGNYYIITIETGQEKRVHLGKGEKLKIEQEVCWEKL